MDESERPVLFLGNSLTDRAVDTNIFKQNDKRSDFFKIVADATSVWDWSCMFNNIFVEHGVVPKQVIIGYAWGETSPVPSRLGGFFCSWQDLPTLVNLGMNRFDQVTSFALSKLSIIYAMHETLRNRFLGYIVPYYAANINAVNSVDRPRNLTQRGQKFQVMRHFIAMLNENDVELVVVLMPVMDSYNLPESFFTLLIQNGVKVLDYRNLASISKDMFVDSIHLGKEGQKIFSENLLTDLFSRKDQANRLKRGGGADGV